MGLLRLKKLIISHIKIWTVVNGIWLDLFSKLVNGLYGKWNPRFLFQFKWKYVEILIKKTICKESFYTWESWEGKTL